MQETRYGKHMCQCKFRNGDCRCCGCIQHFYSFAFRKGNVDIIETDAAARDDFEFLSFRDNLLCYFCCRPDNDAIIVADLFQEFFWRELEFIYLVACLGKNFCAIWRDSVGYE